MRLLCIFFLLPYILPISSFVSLSNMLGLRYDGGLQYPFYSIGTDRRSACQMSRSSATSTSTNKPFNLKSKNKRTKRQRRRKKWDIMLPRLQKFRQEHGHSKVTERDDDFELYEWTKTLRYTYVHQIRNTTTSSTRRFLSEEQLQSLKDVDFVWEPKKRKQGQWDIMIQRLKDFRHEHGHTRIKDSDVDSELFGWAKSLRYNYRHQVFNTTTAGDKKRPLLSESKLNELQKLDFDWGPKRKMRQWDVMVPKLESYRETHGHCMISPTEDLELYEWSKNIRSNYRHQVVNNTLSSSSDSSFPTNRRRPRLSKEKLKKLEGLGFCWDTRSSTWEHRYRELCDYQKQHGHCHVSLGENPQLGRFVQRQRQDYRRYLAGNTTSMTCERIELLSLINFEWAKSRKLAWEERCADLEEYWQTAGHSNVPQDYVTNYQLGQWCMNQRTRYRIKPAERETGLTQERIRKLEKLNFEWSYRQMRWKSMFERLKMYQEENGHLEISTVDSENIDLRQWLNEQRHFYNTNRTSRLSDMRIELMETIPDFSWKRRRGGGPSRDDWSQLFVAIREKGIAPGGKTKEHWFDGVNPFEKEVKTEWTESELVALWNEDIEDDGDKDDGEDDIYLEDEESTSFLRA